MRVVFGTALLVAGLFATPVAYAQEGGGAGGGEGGVTGMGDAATANLPSTVGLGSVSSPGYYGYGDEPDLSRMPRQHGRSAGSPRAGTPGYLPR